MTETCSGSQAGSYLRRLDFVSHISRLENNKEEEGSHLGYSVIRDDSCNLGLGIGAYGSRSEVRVWDLGLKVEGSG